MQNQQKKWLFLVVLALIWGSSFILIKKSLLGLTAFQLGALRILISGVFVLLIGANKLKSIPRKSWKWLILSGFLGTFFPAFLFAIAETEIDSAIASILNSLVPLNTLLIGAAIFKIASTKRQVVGVIIGFVGTAILIGAGMNLNPEQNYWFAGFIIIATVMYATNVNIIKRHLNDLGAVAITASNFIAIMLPALIVLLMSDFFHNATFAHPDFKMSMLYIVILSLFGTAMAKIVFTRLVHIATPVFASSVTYLMPIVALVWGLLDGESFNLIQGFATLFILLGINLAQKK